MKEGYLEERVLELEKTVEKHKRRFQKIRDLMKTEPEVFGFDDMAQQTMGAALLSSPFCATEEIWRLADSLSGYRLICIAVLSVILGVIMIYFTDYQRVADHRQFGQYVPMRIISLVAVSYGIVTVILFTLGVFDYGLSLRFEPVWRLKVVVLVGFFAILGGAVADVIR